MVIINKIKLPTNDYSPVLAFLIDSNAGDTSKWEYLESLSEFYQKYNTYNYSYSYEFAANLLSLGYKIVIKNKNISTNFKNVRIFKNLQYTHINLNKDYTSNLSVGKELSVDDLLSFDIIMKSDLKDQDYLLLNNGYYNILIWWNISNNPIEDVPVSTDNWFKLIDLKSLQFSDFVEELKKLGYKIEIIEDNKHIRVYNFSDLKIVKTSSENLNVDYTFKNGTYDTLAYYYDSLKLIDIIAKIPSQNNDLKCKISFDGLKFIMSVYKYNKDAIIYDEYFSDLTIKSLFNNVSENSKLIKIIINTTQESDLSLISGTYELKRELDFNDITEFNPEYEELIDKFYIDIYIDLFNENLPDGNYLFFSKNKNNKNNNLVIFDDNDLVISNNNILPITFAFLYSYIINYSFLGVIDFKFSLQNYSNNDNNDLINKIKFDNFNYYIDKCRYKNQEVSVIIVKFLLSNYLYRNLYYNIEETEINFLLSTFYSNMNKDIVKSITLTEYDDSSFSKLSIKIELQLTYESIDLIEDISLDLIY